ncbi:MAG: ATPase domain-containing protein [Zestosphaera sp.]
MNIAYHTYTHGSSASVRVSEASSSHGFVLGISELDEKLGDSLRYGAMVSIIGAPGTGKTILATTVCYSNALRGHPCLYASLQEFKDRFYKNFARLGFDLRELESRGLFKFVTLTIPGTSEIVEELVSMLENEVIAGKTRVLVIDSLTPLLRAIRDNVSGRAFLQNNLYTLSKLLNGLLVITLEETGIDETMRADVEHVSDIVIHLRTESNKGLLTRFASLIKTRAVFFLMFTCVVHVLCDGSWFSSRRYLSAMRYADAVCLSKPYFSIMK